MGLGLASIAMANNMIIPLLGPIGRDVGLSDQHIGAVHAVAALVVIVSAPWWGKRSDTLGRRPVFVVSLLGVSASTFALAGTLQYALWDRFEPETVFALLLLSRLAYGALGSGALPAAAGFLADISRPEDRLRAMTMPSRAFGLGGLCGLCLVWPAAAVLGYAGPIFLVASLGAFVAVAAFFLIEAVEHRASTSPPEARPSERVPRQHVLLAANMLAFTCASLIQTTVPFLVQDQFDLLTSDAVFISTALGLTLTVATLVALRFARGAGAHAISLAAAGLCCAALGSVVLFAADGVGPIYVAHALIGFGFGLFVPSTQSTLSLQTSEKNQSVAAGWLSAAATMGYVVGPLAGAFLYVDMGPGVYLISMGVLACVAVSLLFVKSP